MRRSVVLSLAVLLAASTGLSQPRRTPVMILDGESGGPYHDWRRVTQVLRHVLDETGLFDVTVVTAPAASGELTTFNPEFSNFSAIVMNYDAPDARWPAPLKA